MNGALLHVVRALNWILHLPSMIITLEMEVILIRLSPVLSYFVVEQCQHILWGSCVAHKGVDMIHTVPPGLVPVTGTFIPSSNVLIVILL